jgi:uncharacterized protein (TIGR01244 family)
MKFAKRAAGACAGAILVMGMVACDSTPTGVEKADLPGIENFSRIDNSSGIAGSTVGFGGATQPSAMAALEREGFATVINLRFAGEDGADVDASRRAAEVAGMNFVHLPFNPKEPDAAVIDEFMAAVGNQSNQPVYIHCSSATRAAALWMIARVLEDGWDEGAAAREVDAIAARPNEAIAFAEHYLAQQAQRAM